MAKIFDPQIHRDEYKLRMLLTNACNRNCVFCLNDFQDKPEVAGVQYLDTGVALCAIASYGMRATRFPKQVYFSGGEPTLHKDLDMLIRAAKVWNCRVTLCTNGSFPESLDDAVRMVDCLHVGTYEKSVLLRQRILKYHGDVQCVYSKRDPYVTLDFIGFYVNAGIHVKIFGDLHDYHTEYELFASMVTENFSPSQVSFRFTGVQQNRGVGCNNCDEYCVTLKGAWVFPNGSVSHCPKRCKGATYTPGTHGSAWVKALDDIEKAHQTYE